MNREKKTKAQEGHLFSVVSIIPYMTTSLFDNTVTHVQVGVESDILVAPVYTAMFNPDSFALFGTELSEQ